MARELDARNLECPQPVVLTKKALDQISEGVLTVKVNGTASIANVRRFAESQGCTVVSHTRGDHTELEIIKGYTCDIPAGKIDSSDKSKQETGAIIYITADRVGPDEELGRHLLKVFIRNMLEVSRTDLPKKIVFVNRGVLVPCHWEETIEELRALQDLGVGVYACGVCLKHYDLEHSLKVGEVGNAFDTVQAFLGSDRLVNIC